MNDGKKSRRRRSSSLIYQEPPESIEHMSDQSALPNVNADWVNAKGEPAASYEGVRSGRFRMRRQGFVARARCSTAWCTVILQVADTAIPRRSLGYPRHMHYRSQATLRRHPRSLSRNFMDAGQHCLHVQLVLDVPLCPRRPLRIQRWGLRQFEYVGADRQWGSVHPSEEVPLECADSPLPSEHTLHTL